LPNQAWTADITYLPTDERWLYLTVMLEFFSRKVVGWSIQPCMTQKLVVDSLRMAWFRRRPAAGLTAHSDRGAQNCGHLFQSAFKAYGMKSSMGRKGDYWDNVPTESLRGSMKRACVYGQCFRTSGNTKAAMMN
jgi:putative transposase